MNPTQYTPDAICCSMGLPAFVEPGWSPLALRLLLTPSFDREVCITITGRPREAARLSVVALAEKLWLQPAPCALAAWRDHVEVPASVFAQAVAGFAEALTADRQSKGRMVSLDGMPVVACLLSDVGLEQFACNPYRPAVSAFVASLIRIAWEACQQAGVRNELAACGRYVALDLPLETVPPVPELFRLAVVGTPDAREEYFKMLRGQGNTAEPAAAPAHDGE